MSGLRGLSLGLLVPTLLLGACENSGPAQYEVSNVRVGEPRSPGALDESLVEVLFDVRNEGAADPVICTVTLISAEGKELGHGLSQELAFTGVRRDVITDIGFPKGKGIPMSVQVACDSN